MENKLTAKHKAPEVAQKSADKKRELAMHAIFSLAELGFARINLRDIAVRSGVSLGVIHYYFENKSELLIFCVRLYKEDFIYGLDELIAQATQADKLICNIADFLFTTVAEHAHIHRLWYDVRAQAQFDEAFRPVVEEFEVLLIQVFERLLSKLHVLGSDYNDVDPLRLYIAVDGWFRYFLQRKLAGNSDTADAFRNHVLAEFQLVAHSLKKRQARL